MRTRTATRCGLIRSREFRAGDRIRLSRRIEHGWLSLHLPHGTTECHRCSTRMCGLEKRYRIEAHCRTNTLERAGVENCSSLTRTLANDASTSSSPGSRCQAFRPRLRWLLFCQTRCPGSLRPESGRRLKTNVQAKVGVVRARATARTDQLAGSRYASLGPRPERAGTLRDKDECFRKRTHSRYRGRSHSQVMRSVALV